MPNWIRSLRVLERRFEAGAGRADRAPDDPVAGLVEAGERAFQRAHLGQDGVGGQAHVVEQQLGGDRGAQAELLVDVLGGEALGALGDEEAADALVGLRPDDGDVGDRAVGDPHLLAVQDPVVAVAAGAGPHRAGVRAGVGLGQAEAADRLAGGHPRQPLLLLLLRAPAPDREHRQRALDRDQAADAASRRPRAPCRRGRRRWRRRRRSRSPRGACRARRACPVRAPARSGIVRLLEPVADVRHDLVADEGADGVADVALLVGEEAVDGEVVVGADRGAAVVVVIAFLDARFSKIEDSRDATSSRRLGPLQHPRLLARPRRAVRDDDARRPRRRGDQGRAARRRRRNPLLGSRPTTSAARRPTSSRSTATRRASSST